MEKKYNPKSIEESIYKFWEESGYFEPDIIQTNKNNYCIVMPPPNITGVLHLGHAFQHTIMDILVRYHRMYGENVLWTVGFDHAGIATQILIENKFHNEKIKFKKHKNIQNSLLKEAWKWKEKSEKNISYQIKRLGCSVSWKNKRFTMDSNASFAVKEAFIRLYQDNLIYKGKKLVNWDYILQTAISDLEVSHKKITGNTWYLRYQLEQKIPGTYIKNSDNNYLVIATTRPETIFGDVAIAVHPKDNRYHKFIGKSVLIPIINRSIPIISDEYVNIDQGTGCLKVTPGHDFNDYIIGKKHKLPIISIFSTHRKILEEPKIFNNQDHPYNKIKYSIPKIFQNTNCDQARKMIIEECSKQNLLEDIKNQDLIIPYNNKTKAIIEPILTDQWYIKTKKLAEKAIKIVKTGEIEFIPKKYENTYFQWMQNIQDWCISRQIWWGHRIPVWYDNNDLIYVGHCEKDIRIQNQLSNNVQLRQDNNVLDTWFSSSLWSFSSLGWPQNTSLLNIFHPTNIIISGFDIIFFWIARMIMMTTYLIKDKNKKSQIPFKKIYITGLIRDKHGKKMSKSQGNIINPLNIIDGILQINTLQDNKNQTTKKNEYILSDTTNNIHIQQQFLNGIKPYGSDSLRLTLTSLASFGKDIHWDPNRLEGYHNFCNKLWNSSKFVLINTINQDCGINNNIEEKLFSLPDQWIISKLHQTIQSVHKELRNYRFDKIVNILYEFTWHQFCDWYIELIKPILNSNMNKLQLIGTRYTLITSFETLLRLIHPIIPFITEKIWQKIKLTMQIDKDTIMLQPYPKYNATFIDLNSIENVEWIKSFISELRTLRKNIAISYKIPLKIVFNYTSEQIKKCILENNHILTKIINLDKIDFLESEINHINRSLKISLYNSKLTIFLPDNFDKKPAIHKLNQEIESINHKINFIKKILNNRNYNKYKKTFLMKEQEKLKSYNKTKNKLLEHYFIIKKL